MIFSKLNLALLLIISLQLSCSRKVPVLKNNLQTYKSFVKVKSVITIKDCKEVKNCKPDTFGSVGSGFAIVNVGNNTIFLTAGHVCVHKLPESFENIIYKTHMQVETWDKNVREPRISVIPKEYNLGLDLCIMEVENLTIPPIKVSIREPEFGDRVYSMAAPVGEYFAPYPLMLDGLFSGPAWSYFSRASLPAVGGSSGSPVMNSNGKLIGLLFAINKDFAHSSLLIRLEHIKKFVATYMIKRKTLLNTRPKNP